MAGYTIYAGKPVIDAMRRAYESQEDTEVKPLTALFFSTIIGKKVHIHSGPVYVVGTLKIVSEYGGNEYYGFSRGKYAKDRVAVSFTFDSIRSITVCKS